MPAASRLCIVASALAGLLLAPAGAPAASVTIVPGAGSSVTARGAGFPARHRVELRLAGRRVARPVAGRRGRFTSVIRRARRSTGPRALVSRAGAVRVLNVVAPGGGQLGQLATSKGARVLVDGAPAIAGGALRLHARGLRRGALVRARLGHAPAVGARIGTSGRATAALTLPRTPGRVALVVRVGRASMRLAVPVRPAAATTPQPGDAASRLVAVGDISCPAAAPVTATTCHQAATASLAAGLAPDAVALLGDVQYDAGSLADFQASFAPTWGVALGPRLRPIPGNHEYARAGAAGYFTYFGSAAGDRGRGWYSYDLGAWHLVALNTNTDCTAVPCSAGSEQERWLRDDLAAHPARCTIVYWHHPRFSSGPHGNSASVDALWRTAAAGGADLALTGHDHLYERFAPQDSSGAAAAGGLREFVVGTGGRSHYALGVVKPNSEARLAGVFGVLELELRNGSYGWRFVAEDGSVRDQGTGACA